MKLKNLLVLLEKETMVNLIVVNELVKKDINNPLFFKEYLEYVIVETIPNINNFNYKNLKSITINVLPY